MRTKSLAEVSKLTEETARQYLESLLWPEGPVCPHCKSKNATRVAGLSGRPGLLMCNDCRNQFTVTVGTIFEDSHIPLRSWIIAFQMMCASKKGVSAKQVQRQLGLGSYKSAWFMCHRIRYAMTEGPMAGMLKGTVEADETYVGGKPRPGTGPHKRGRGTKKAPVVALVERGGNVRTKVVASVSHRNLRQFVDKNICKSATVNTDEFNTYIGLLKNHARHDVVNHGLKQYARHNADGTVSHCNTAESFFSLLKRGVYGAFHHISKKHLPRYCDEFSFRWNRRGMTDGERTEAGLKNVAGKRLMYQQPAKMFAEAA
ncbi:MAG: IS1595 family transposase [Verrucomicrobiota bacterium]|jgi:transposase-like protein